ncbi:TRAF-like superfamily protein [Hibiscus syriacus]|uniref:TRAF-like superfamily protein n=1 Tax=Hibiscus syriacus TaxID=106335 RepID=A0A6A3BFH6_HIBSY|nr:TRAF-like superfamily protein [Hibiscus syriacus]
MRVLNIALVSLLLLLVLQYHAIGASRILHELHLQSLQKGTIPPSVGSSCTNIPGRGGPPCHLNEMHYAAAATFPRSTAYPQPMLQLGVAPNQI